MDKKELSIVRILREYIKNCTEIPFTNKCIVDKKEVLGILQEIEDKEGGER